MEIPFEDKVISFESKLYTKGKSDFVAIRAITFIFVIVYSFLLTLDLFKGHYDGFMIWKHIFTYSMCIVVIYITRATYDYKQTMIDVKFGEDKVVVSYRVNPDCKVYIPPSANVTLFYNNIESYRYDEITEEFFIKEISSEYNDETHTIIYMPRDAGRLLEENITNFSFKTNEVKD